MFRKLCIFILLVPVVAYAQLPEEPGPYEVGCRLRVLEKESVTDTTTRVMDIYVWYPADPGSGFWLDEVQAYWNARPLPGDTARPVLVFSHGGCGYSLASRYFTTHIASWGIIVISTMHPGSIYGDPDCLDSAALTDTWANRPSDVEFTLNSIIQLSRDSVSLFGHLDTTRMGMSGHSFGARTTYAVCNRQDWARCAVAFSGDYDDVLGAPINCMEDVRGVDVPMILMNGTHDLGLSTEHMLEIFDSIPAPKYALNIRRATHFSFADTCLDELDPFCGEDFVLGYDTAHAIINRYATSFIFKYLVGDDRFEECLTDTADTLVNLWYQLPARVEEDFRPGDFSLSVYPNPFNSSCWISVSANASVEVFDILGRQLFSAYGIGNHRCRWRPDKDTPSGLYIVRATSCGRSLTKWVVYLK